MSESAAERGNLENIYTYMIDGSAVDLVCAGCGGLPAFRIKLDVYCDLCAITMMNGRDE